MKPPRNKPRLFAAAVLTLMLLLAPASVAMAEPTPQPTQMVVADGWYTWEVHLKKGVTVPKNSDHVTWPQPLVGAGQLTPTKCGSWYQQDHYRAPDTAVESVVKDGLLKLGEDFSIVKEWKFVYAGDCTADGKLAHTGPPEWVPYALMAGGIVLVLGAFLKFGTKKRRAKALKD